MNNQEAARVAVALRSGIPVATGSIWKETPMAVIVNTPSVRLCSAASAGPGPPAKKATWFGKAAISAHNRIWKNNAAVK